MRKRLKNMVYYLGSGRHMARLGHTEGSVWGSLFIYQPI